MSKIYFVSTSPALFSPNDLNTRGMGGTEKMLIYLSNYLSNNYDVTVFCNTIKEKKYNNVNYKFSENIIKTLQQDKDNNSSPDILIILRDSNFTASYNFKKLYNVKKVILWCHDFAVSPIHNMLPYVKNTVDKIVAVSNWHKSDLVDTYNLDPHFVEVIHNGVDTNLFNYKNSIKKPFKFIYTSTPLRGLKELLDIFPDIRKELPNAELNIFSGLNIYNDGQNDEYEFLYKKANRMKGIIYHGTAPGHVIAEHLKESELMLYPNTYNETCCISAMEAIHCMCPVITSDKAALTEVVDTGGCLIKGEPGTKEYNKTFVTYVSTLIRNRELLQDLQLNCKQIDWGLNKCFKKWTEIIGDKK